MSTGSCDEGSNLVRETTSPTSSGPDVDEVFDHGGQSASQSSSSNGSDNKKHYSSLLSSPLAKGAAGSSSSASASPKQSPFKKSKASKGLGFLLKAREGAKKGRSKSPLSFSKSPLKSKKGHEEDDDEFLKNSGDGTFSETDDKTKAKSEHWQAFLQMQDRIKQNVLKTQTSIGKHVSGRISPSGRTSPGKDKHDSEKIPFSILSERESTSSDAGFDQIGESATGASGVEETVSSISSSNPFSSNFDTSSDHTNLLSSSVSHSITVSSPSPPSAVQPRTNFIMDAFDDLLGLDQPNNTPVCQADKTDSVTNVSSNVDEFDLLGLSSDSAPVEHNDVNMSKQSSINEDLLGLDDFASIPTSRDVSHDNLSSDWFGGSSTAQSSAQSSLCPSPVHFDLDMLSNQGMLKTESTAVSDLARTLVDDFLQWGANLPDEPLSKNPFQSDDLISDQAMMQNSFNPFATIVEDDPDCLGDGLGGFGEKNAKTRDSGGPNILSSDPFSARNTTSSSHNQVAHDNVIFDPFAPVSSHSDPPLDINANAAPLPSAMEDFVSSSSATAAPAAAAENNVPPLRPAQQPKGRKTSRKSSNPFIISDEDLVDGAVEFDDNFFASRGIFHAAPEKRSEDSIWGVGSATGDKSVAPMLSFTDEMGVGGGGSGAANPFQHDLFTADSFNQMKDHSDGLLETVAGKTSEPINPFLTASFENIASQNQSQPLPSDNPFAAMLAGSPARSPARTPSPSSAATNALDDFLKPEEPSSSIKVSSNDVNDVIFDPFASSNVTSSSNSQQPIESLLGVESSSSGVNVNVNGNDDDPLDIFSSKPPEIAAHPSSKDDDDDDDEHVGIKLKLDIKDKSQISDTASSIVPALPPPPKPPKSPQIPQRENPFNKESPPEENFASFAEIEEELRKKAEAKAAEEAEAKDKRLKMRSMTSEDSSPDEEGPLEPLEPFYPPEERDCWKLMIRHPMKKKLGGNRFWKTTIVRLGENKEGPIVRLFMEEKDTEPFQELPLQPCYSLSDVSMQQYDQFGKIHTIKIQYIFYRERVGIRPDRITTSLVRKPKPNMILDHAPQVSELIKMGCLDKDEITSFLRALQDTLMRLQCHRDKPLNYTKDEVQAEVWDEYQAVIDKDGHVTSQKGRVRIFFLAFLTGMPACELGISDRRRKGREVVGRHDIIPVRTEDWIRIEDPEFHNVVDLDTYKKTNNIRFFPLDACQFELVRFRVRPKENKELPLQLKVTQDIKDRKYEVRVNLLVTGYHAFSKKCGQFPCEDIEVHIKIPEVWIYYFRYEKRFGYGSLKAMARKPGKIKGLERITMMAQGLLTPALMEASVGSAKYEHLYRAVVWRIPRLPERNHGAYKNHLFVLHLNLGPHDEVPPKLETQAHVSFTMPASTVSKAQVRSISVEKPNPPEKWVRYVAKYSYVVDVDTSLHEDQEDPDASD